MFQIGQETDPIISVIYRALIKAQPPYKQSPSHPLNRYIQIWHQLVLENDIEYIPSPSEDMVIVPILPPPLRQEALFQSHDVPMAGHQGAEKTLQRQAYWVNMAQDVQQYCNSCTKCQQAKSPSSIRAPLTNIPIGHPWQMIAIDILEVPISRNNNRYLLVIQDPNGQKPFHW